MEHLLPTRLALTDLVRQWLKDDAPFFDIGGFVVGGVIGEARLLGKSKGGVLAGRLFAQGVFDAVGGLQVVWHLKDGDEFDGDSKNPVVIATVKGEVRSILLAERTALNILSRASGIATQAKRLVALTREVGWKGQVAATRKTTPGFALVEKYACLVGGASTHRINLSQAVMLKDNHVWSVNNNITDAVAKAKSAAGFSSIVEVECQTFEEACEAADAGAHVVMLDNYKGDRLKNEAARLKAKYPHLLIEASGGIDETSIKSYLSKDVDIVSIGKLTQGYPCLDFSLKIPRPDSSSSTPKKSKL